MITFEVNNMTCGHCVASITKALKAVDPGARVEIDLASRCVHIEPTVADEMELSDAIKEAGYTPMKMAHTQPGSGVSTGRACCR